MEKMVQELNDPDPPSLLMAEKVVDVQNCMTIDKFLTGLDEAFPPSWISKKFEALKKLFSTNKWKLFAKVGSSELGCVGAEMEKGPEHSSAQSWHSRAKMLQQRLSPLPLFICLDEFPLFLDRVFQNNAQEGAQFLSWLRSWRQSKTECRFILAGSIGIQSLLLRFEQTTQFNDSLPYHLGPFSKGAALQMLGALSQRENNLRSAPQVLDTLCERTGWLSPYFLTIFFCEAQRVAQERILETQPETELLELADVEIARQQFRSDNSRFRHWVWRLERDFTQNAQALALAKAILNHIARTTKGLTRKQLANRLSKILDDQNDAYDRLNQVLLYLNENGYITAEEPYQFLSFLLRDYWKHNYAPL